ncbi:MAG: rod shape-determining protein MreC [Gemmatimonadetes bacterium]|nr:rod shape-determining protein MreC [Gemmatimonadota bacterium]
MLPGAYKEAIASVIRSTLLRPVIALQQGSVERAARFDDPMRLRAERDSLAAYLVGHASLSTENRLLRDMLGLRERLPPSFIPAEIIRIPGRGAEGFFQLTAGTMQGVRAGAPIVSVGGLVGRVTIVDENVSFGIDWMNSDFRAAAMTVDGEVYGIVEPRRGPNGEPLLALTGTPRHVEITDGTVIVTSGHGGIYPRGVPIGVIRTGEGEATDWQRSYVIHPMVAPGEMAYVLVLGDPQAGLGGQDLAETWGIRPAPDRVAADTTAAGASAGIPALPGSGAAGAPATAPAASPPAQTGPRLLGTPVSPQPDPDGR